MNKKYIILAFTPSSLINNYLWIRSSVKGLNYLIRNDFLFIV